MNSESSTFEIAMPIGDWSADGHGRCEEVDFISNYDVHALRDAYKKSVVSIGISFDSDTNRGIARQICTNYEQAEVPAEVMKQLAALGYNVPKDILTKDGSGLYHPEEFCKLILWFIGISMPDDWKWEIKKQPKKVYLNGWWNDELNVQFGYGLFY